MEDLKAVTWRSTRTLLERLSGWPAAYRCRVTDGYRYADSRGPSAEAAEDIARGNWRKEHGSKRGTDRQGASAQAGRPSRPRA